MKLCLPCVLFVVVAFAGAAPLAKTAPKAIPAHTSEENLKREVVEKVREALSSGEGKRALEKILDQTNNNIADTDVKDAHTKNDAKDVTKKSSPREDELRDLIVKNVQDALQKGEGKAALQELYDESDESNVDDNKHDEGAGLGTKNVVPAAIENELEQDEKAGTPSKKAVVPSRDVQEDAMVNDLPNDMAGTGSVPSNEKKSDEVYNGIEDITPNDGEQLEDVQNGIEDIYPNDGEKFDDVQNGIEDISPNDGAQSDDIQNGMFYNNAGIEGISSNEGMQADDIQNDIEDISSNVGIQSDNVQNGIIYNNADAPNPSVQEMSLNDGMRSEQIKNGYIINDNAYFNPAGSETETTGGETEAKKVGRSRDDRTNKFESLDAIMNDESTINKTVAKNSTVTEIPSPTPTQSPSLTQTATPTSSPMENSNETYTEESPVSGNNGGDEIMGNGYFMSTEPRNEVGRLDVKSLLGHHDEETVEAREAPVAPSYHAHSIEESKDVVDVADVAADTNTIPAGADTKKVKDESNRKDSKEEDGGITVEQNGYWE